MTVKQRQVTLRPCSTAAPAHFRVRQFTRPVLEICLWVQHSLLGKVLERVSGRGRHSLGRRLLDLLLNTVQHLVDVLVGHLLKILLDERGTILERGVAASILARLLGRGGKLRTRPTLRHCVRRGRAATRTSRSSSVALARSISRISCRRARFSVDTRSRIFCVEAECFLMFESTCAT